MASFELNPLFKGLLSKYSFILRYRELGLRTYEFGGAGRGDTVQPIAEFKLL